METDQLPEELAALTRWLTSEGFALAEQQSSEAFGDRLLIYKREACRVRLIRDRGQWSLEINGSGQNGWFEAEIWRSCLEGENPSTGSIPLSEQATYLRKSLTQIEDALLNDPEIDDCLRQRGLWRTRAILGLTR